MQTTFVVTAHCEVIWCSLQKIKLTELRHRFCRALLQDITSKPIVSLGLIIYGMENNKAAVPIPLARSMFLKMFEKSGYQFFLYS